MGHGRIPIIEAMRGLAAVSVALFHFSVQLNQSARDAFAYGWLGVDVFFVISGFVIPLSLHGRGYTVAQFPEFMARRLVRLEPPYLASIVLVLLVWYVSAAIGSADASDPAYSWPQVASHLLYAIPLTSYSWISPVYWSLAYEFAFYIVTGLTFVALIKRSVEWTVLLAALVTGLLYLRESAFDVCVAEFLAGIIVMRLVTGEGSRARLWFWLAATVAISAYGAGLWVAAAIAGAAAAILFLRHVRLGRWAFVAGSLSYSLYLTHASVGVPAVLAGRSFGSGLAFEAALMVAGLAVSIVFAWLFSRAVEGPSIRASRQIVLRPEPA
jgi:peptidoglycan/LPS O-acetylase OafA/YrhL